MTSLLCHGNALVARADRAQQIVPERIGQGLLQEIELFDKL
jgi:hypothetical protein